MADRQWKASPRAASAITLMTSELDSLILSAAAMGAEIENEISSHDLYVDLDLYVAFKTAPVADQVVECYFVRQVVGGAYEDAAPGSTATSIILPRNGWVGNFVVRATTSAQRMIIPHVLVPPRNFKPLLFNKASAVTSVGNVLTGYFYREQIT